MDDSVNWAIMHDSCTVTMAMKSFFVLADLLCEKSTQLNEQWWWKVDWCFCSIIQNEVELFTLFEFCFWFSSLPIYIIFQTLKLNFYFKMWKEDANVEYKKVRWWSKYETNEPVASYWELRGCQKCEWSELKKLRGGISNFALDGKNGLSATGHNINWFHNLDRFYFDRGFREGFFSWK